MPRDIWYVLIRIHRKLFKRLSPRMCAGDILGFNHRIKIMHSGIALTVSYSACACCFKINWENIIDIDGISCKNPRYRITLIPLIWHPFTHYRFTPYSNGSISCIAAESLCCKVDWIVNLSKQGDVIGKHIITELFIRGELCVQFWEYLLLDDEIYYGTRIWKHVP